ncbi:MAG TPA: amino acid adenylation domain-containing protein, partial [Thermoanaerobaculia bacterium]|nr:amino acid adenylation domain-containing protein [Thermoanaerobaculia bacterium]
MPVSISARTTEALKRVGQRHEATLFMVLAAAFQTLLGRLVDQSDVLVGSPIAGRHLRETQSLIGFFVNTVVLRGRLADEEGESVSFGELVKRTRRACLEAYAHQDLPFEKLVEDFQLPRSLAHNPLFQVIFSLQSTPLGDVRLPGITVRSVGFQTVAVKFDLGLPLAEVEGELRGDLEYATDLFDRTTALRLAASFRVLLEGIAADPERRLTELPLMPEIERHQLLREWVDTRSVEATWTPSHRRFEEQARRTPEAVAVTMGLEALTFDELDRWADRIAGRLRDLGVSRGSRVGVLAERSPALVAAVLGIWKAGGAYVPLDPALPSERLSYMIEDSEARVLLTQERLADLSREGLPVLAGSQEGAASDTDLAYVIYTSGTSGLPKAVLVEHGHLAHTLQAAQAAFGFGPEDRIPCLAPFSFDIFLFELLGPLLAGGRIDFVPLRPTLDVPALVSSLSDGTLLHAVPALMRQVVEEVRRQGRSPSLRQVFVGGDAVPLDLLAEMRQAFPQAQLTVLYGPTEATIIASHYEDGAGTEDRNLLGRPLPDVALRVMDRQGAPAPVGVPGELWVGGPGVARGYLHQPELTAEKFVEREGSRWYRTGDLARWLADGNLEFLGRIDHQVKLRGFRIELGEIEAALAADPTVRQAVVLALGDDEERRLVAYVVPAARQPLSASDWAETLRQHLVSRLPEYMVPSGWTVLDELPVTAHGKVDRRALSELGTNALASREHVPPRTPVEQVLAVLWSDLLSVERVGAHDDFFALGGHSLLATRLVSRVREAFGVELPLRAIFEAPTVQDLAARIEKAAPEEAGSAATPVLPVPDTGPLLEARLEDPSRVAAPEGDSLAERLAARQQRIAALRARLTEPQRAVLDRLQTLAGAAAAAVTIPKRAAAGWAPLSFAQERLWFLDRLQPGSPFYNIAAAMRLTGRLEVAMLAAALAEIVRRHESLRTTFEERDGSAVQVVQPPFELRLPVANLCGLPADTREAEVLRLTFAEAGQPFDLEAGPLLRAGILRLEEEEWIVVMTIHHIVSDAWSVGVLIQESTRLYEAFAQGRPSPLPALPIQYSDFAAWERTRLRGENLDRQLAHWKREVEGAPAVLELPADRPRPPVQSFRGAAVPVSVPLLTTEALKRICQRNEATLFMVLAAAFQTLLGRLSGQSEVLIGTPIAGRNQAETESLIGFFVNTVVLRGRLADAEGESVSLVELVRRTRMTCLEAYAHQDLPFEKLVEDLHLPRSLAHNPLFQVIFALQNAPLGELRLPGLTVRSVGFQTVSV